jgi:hypothetical protein
MELDHRARPIASSLADADAPDSDKHASLEESSFEEVPDMPEAEGLSVGTISEGRLTDDELEDMEKLVRMLRAERRSPSATNSNPTSPPLSSPPTSGRPVSMSAISDKLDRLLGGEPKAPPERNNRKTMPSEGLAPHTSQGEPTPAPLTQDVHDAPTNPYIDIAELQASEAPSAPHQTFLSSRPAATSDSSEPSPTDRKSEPAPSSSSGRDMRRTQPVPLQEQPQDTPQRRGMTRLPGVSLEGRAGHDNGSGFIFLPTPEIREALAEGPYRLCVDGQKYGPLDEAELVELIKHGVLMGGEEIATLDGPWVRVVQHDAFRRLRSKMAQGAHQLLEEMSIEGRPTRPGSKTRREEGERLGGERSERDGHSGFILLPTEEIDSSIAKGRYRLRIGGEVHGPVDASVLVMLVKHGALFGTDEIAALDGPWLPVTRHPVFDALRRRMAAGAHGVLRELGAEAVREPKRPTPPETAERPSPPSIPPAAKEPAAPTTSQPTQTATQPLRLVRIAPVVALALILSALMYFYVLT